MKKTIKVLLKMMIIFIEKDKFRTGLCAVISDMHWCKIITEEERSILHWYIHDRIPPYSKRHLGTAYWWMPGNKAPRLRWLKKHINKLNNKS